MITALARLRHPCTNSTSGPTPQRFTDSDPVGPSTTSCSARSARFASQASGRRRVVAGFQVVAFDGPGHGGSAGNRSSLMEFASAFEAVVDATQPFFQPLAGVIAHSMGGAAVTLALRRKRKQPALGSPASEAAPRLVFVAPPIDVGDFISTVSNELGLSPRARGVLEHLVERRVGKRIEELHGPAAISAEQASRFRDAARFAERFFMAKAEVHEAMRVLCETLERDGTPYAIGGAMALNAHGYQRVTTDVDVLLTKDGLRAFREAHLGRGWVERFPGSFRRNPRVGSDGLAASSLGRAEAGLRNDEPGPLPLAVPGYPLQTRIEPGPRFSVRA